VGYTVGVNGNRVSEGFDDCEASILSVAFALNSTTNNIGTHCIEVLPFRVARVTDSGNMTLLRSTDSCAGLTAALQDLIEEFVVFLFDQFHAS
jgi:hypothetical protein